MRVGRSWFLFFLLSLLSTKIGKSDRPGFYAFFNGVPKMDPEKEAVLLKSLGYDGISQLYASEGGGKLAKRVAAYEKSGVKVLSIYLPATKDPIKPEVVHALANKGGMIELTVQRIDDEIISSIGKTAEMAEKLGIKVVLYPHAGFAVATMPQAMELIKTVKHPNLGVMFNLCHFLKNEKAEDLEKVLEAAGDRLFAVSTCGADLDGKGWNTLIQTLDKGSFPQKRLFKKLREVGFKGPVGIQGYGLKGDRAENLKASSKTWQKLWEGGL